MCRVASSGVGFSIKQRRVEVSCLVEIRELTSSESCTGGACILESNSVLFQEITSVHMGQVWNFIIEREVEAPERFQAIQSYRATMAVLRQQRTFIKSLLHAGVIEDLEHNQLQACARGCRLQSCLQLLLCLLPRSREGVGQCVLPLWCCEDWECFTQA